MIGWLLRLRCRLWPTILGHRQLLRQLRRGDRYASRHRFRALCRTISISDRMAVTRILGRYKIYVDPSDYGISVNLMMDGYWELPLTQEIARVVTPGMVVADVGANLGYFTLLMADLVGPGGHVLAFEPNPHVADLLRRSLHANGFEDVVTLSPDPLGAATGMAVTLNVNPGQPGGAFISSRPEAKLSEGVALHTRRFDEHPDAMRVAFAKIDAEGSEAEIWAGMSAMLAGDALRMIVMEYCGSSYPDPAAFLGMMIGAGFTLASLEPDRGVVPVTREEILGAAPTREWLLVLRR